LSQNYDTLDTHVQGKKYVFKYNKSLLDGHYTLSLTNDKFNINALCFRWSEICEIIRDYNLIDIKISRNDKNNLSTNDKNILNLIQTYHERYKK
jgi:hypothetical protein